jgi:Zn-finger nucleic acid-binding protein
MQCPKCKQVMEKVVFAEIEVDRCTGCRGLFFDSREAERLKKTSGSEAIDVGDAEVGKKYNETDRIRCPRDTTPMVRVVDPKQSHIWTETCPVCFGSFFDAGEFRDFKQETFGDVLKSWFTRERS